ncbi:MAG: O-methyltransferase, partial [Promethearchaeota archaeon]
MNEDPLIPGLQDYMTNLLPERDPIFKEMEVYAEKIGFPIVGPLVGQYLMQYARLVQPKRIIELGSGFGYSALWFAKAVSSETEIFMTDYNPDNKKRALSYLE